MDSTLQSGNPRLQYIASCIGIIFFGVAFLTLGAILPAVAAEYGLDDRMSATLAAILPIGTLAGSLIFGPVVDRKGYKLVMIVQNLIGAAGLFLIAYASSFTVLITGILALGVSGGLINGSTNALASDVSTDSNRDRNIMFLGLFYCVGAIATTYSIPALSGIVSYKSILATIAAIMVVVSVFYMTMKFQGAKTGGEGASSGKIMKLLTSPLFIIFCFTLFFQGAVEGITNNRISQYLINIENFNEISAGIALSFVLIGLAIGRLCAGFILKKFSKRTIIAAGMIIALAGVAILTFAQDISTASGMNPQSIAVAGTLLIGFGITSTVPIVLSVLGGLYKEMSGTAFSIAISACLVGNSLLNYLLGFLGIAKFPLMIGGCMVMIIILFTAGSRKSVLK